MRQKSLTRTIRKLKRKTNRLLGRQPELFSGFDKMFKEAVSNARIYAEYGCGTSTLWVARNLKCRVLSVDTSAQWIARVREQLGDRGGVEMHFVDAGPLLKWGRPEGYGKAENFSDYTDWFWSLAEKPDTVLIDGRFRVCCFLTSLRHAPAGATIIFDDYVGRKHYHYVERFLKPVESNGRQARFTVPDRQSLDIAAIEQSIERFRFVLD
jgi:hypothetical protein